MAAPMELARGERMLEVRLFGHTEMRLDGAPFKFATPRRSLQVLAYLLLHRSAPVTREYLAFVLFPDEEEADARTKLRSTLSDMPKILPAPFERYVSVDGDNVTWNPDAPLWLDVDAFVAASADPARLSEAIELYRGDLLPQIYDEWLESPRERYRNTYVRCLNEFVSTARRNADFGSAIEVARKILTVDPWREDIVRRIVAMRYESGDRGGALSEYRDFAKRLREEMNAEPMPESAALIEQIRRGAELAAADDERLPIVAGAVPVLPFVGRTAQLDVLLDTWNAVASGRGTFAFIAGETGIGKSRLALEFAHGVEERGGRALTGTTSFPEAVPYESVTEAMRGALPLLAALKPDLTLASLASIAPELRARVALPDVPRLSGESERVRLFDALCRSLGRLAAQRPLLLVLEDLQWAGSATHDMLQFLVRRIAGTRTLVLATYRDDETPRTHPLQHLRNDARARLGATTIHLGRLSVSDVANICSALPDERTWPIDELAAASQGHPHFLTQAVLDLREGAREAHADSLGMLLQRRLGRLSPQARTAAEIAACIGDNFSRDALREVSAWDETILSDALDELLDRRIVRESTGRALFEYSFVHHAVHEAVALAVAPQPGAARRLRVARVLQELYPERAPELSASVARHYDLGGDAANAAHGYLNAARYSISIGALEEARSQSERGVELAPDLRLRCELLLERVTVESRRAERRPWNEALCELERTEAKLGDTEIHRSTLLERIEYGRVCEDRPARVCAARELRESIDGDEPYWEAQAYLAEQRLAFDDDRLAEAYAAGEKGLAFSRRAGDHDTTARILCDLALTEAHRGRLSSAGDLFRATREEASHAADRTIRILPVRSELAAAHQRRDTRRALELAQQWVDLATELGDRPQQAKAHDMVAVSIAATGTNLAEARRHFAIALELGEESALLRERAGTTANQAILETRLGFFDRGRALTEKALELFASAGHSRGRTTCLDNLTLLRAFTGDLDGARAAAHEALDLTRLLGLTLNEASALENLALAEAQAGNFERAIDLAESSFEVRSRSESQIWSCKTLADTAIWHARLGNIAAARDAVRRLLAGEEKIVDGTDFPTYCFWAAAQIFHFEGRAAEAARVLEKGRRILQATAEDLDGEDRAQFLAIPWNVELMRAVEADVWPDPPR